MARLPYAGADSPERCRVADRVIAERGSLLHLYRMLLHSPPLAEGWLTYLTAIRQKNSLPGDLRELVIMRVAHINGASYEADQHAPIALKEGLTEDQLAALRQEDNLDRFSDLQCAVLAYADAMTRNVQVDDSVFGRVSTMLPPSQLVELTATIAAYNMVSRFLEALQIQSHDSHESK